jgi:GT2 family glycosyltransferase
MITIAIVVPVFNRKKVTIEGLANIQEALIFYGQTGQNTLDFNIIVVDDGSTDGTGEWLQAHRPDVICLKGDGNLWWSGSINLGAKYAVEKLEASHVLFWNDDTICAKDYFYELEKSLLSNAKLLESIIVSKIFWLGDVNKLLFNFGCYFNPKNGKKTIIGLNTKDNYNEIIAVDWSGGMGTLIPVSVLKAVNYLDAQNFPQYDGDIDFFLRAKEKNYAIYAIPTLHIFNNPETTGISNNNNKIKDLPAILTSHRSLHNVRKNIRFNLRHSNTIVSWVLLARDYLSLLYRLKLK